MKIGIIGLGITGNAVADYALSSGDEVFISESKPFSNNVKTYYSNLARKYGKIPAEFGGHTSRLLLSSDIIVKSPGISQSEKIIIAAKKKGIPIVGELDFIFSRLTKRPLNVVAITGTNGKTTTTTLIGHILKNSKSFVGKNEVIVCGNIGVPLASVAGKITARSTLVIEVSSYQLEDALEFYPDIGIILNITPDHLEHHKTMSAYIEAKSKIFTLQKNAHPSRRRYCVLNYDNSICRALSKKVPFPSEAVFFTTKELPLRIEKNFKWARYAGGDEYVFCINNSPRDSRRVIKENIVIRPRVVGMHNVENILAAVSAVKLTDNKIKIEEIKKCVESFRGVEHRQEFVRCVKGVSYINDSKATNVDSTKVALESYAGGNLWLILGGRDKGSPYAPLRKLISQKVKGVFLIGEAATKIHSELAGASPLMFNSGDLKMAVKKAFSLAVPGDIVLLSPACASFDQYRNFEHRGEEFKKIVMSLPDEK